MPFFENAKQFEINGGNFIDIKGNQNNYNYDQSLHVSGQGNSAFYNRGTYNRGGDSHAHNTAGQMTVIGQGSSANVGLGAGAIPMNYSAPHVPHPSHFDQSYNHLQASVHAMASSLGQGPSMPNGMFNQSTGHIPQNFPPPSPQPHQQHQFAPAFSPPPQPAYNTYPASQPQQVYNQNPRPPLQQVHNQSPPPPQQVYNQNPSPPPQQVYNQNPSPPPQVYNHQSGPPQHYPTHQPQASVQSAPPTAGPVSAPLIQITQTTHQRNPSHTSVASQPPHMVPLPPSQPSSPPLGDSHATAQSNAFLGATAPMSSPSASSLTGSTSGTTLVQSPQPTTQPVLPSPTSSATTTTTTPTPTSSSLPVPAPTAIEASASSASAPAAAPGQGEQPALTEFPGLKLRPGATIVSLDEDVDKKKKKKKKNIFSRMFGKSPKGTTLAANA